MEPQECVVGCISSGKNTYWAFSGEHQGQSTEQTCSLLKSLAKTRSPGSSEAEQSYFCRADLQSSSHLLRDSVLNEGVAQVYSKALYFNSESIKERRKCFQVLSACIFYKENVP